MRGSSALVLSCAAMLGVGLANIDIRPHPVKTVTRTITIRETHTRTKIKQVVAVREVVKAGVGYMTAKQCHALKRGERFRDVVAQYGWPVGEQASGSDYSILSYRIGNTAEGDKECQIDFFEGGVDRVAIEEAF